MLQAFSAREQEPLWGAFDPTEGALTVGEIALIGGGAGLGGDVIGQLIGNIGKPCHSFNIGEALGAGIGGAIGGYMGGVITPQRLRLIAAPSQCIYGLVSGRRSAPDRSVHSRRVLALIVRHSLYGQRSAAERVGQQPLQGFHLAVTAFLCCLDDTRLQSPDLLLTLRPVDLFPLSCRAGGCTHRLLHVHLRFPPAKIP